MLSQGGDHEFESRTGYQMFAGQDVYPDLLCFFLQAGCVTIRDIFASSFRVLLFSLPLCRPLVRKPASERWGT
ncbi:hypothetical protein SAMN02910314_01289 [Denitrobacterium detoxificans]|uniref:Uncharacterized protein n=1 Tax=Denitrobacterium detoxificans TaxID=79604 RepID=A0A1H8SRE0_9ACTN|nr:hypothetical protein SAMN02910314_01289 [Denitrobacterium detoxificans]